MSSSSEDSDVGYRGPTVGRARARVDYVPSPYDREALRFSRGDIIDVISMNPSGLWRGALHGRVGTFKFINVEVLPDELARLREAGGALPPLKTRPVSVKHLLEELGVPVSAASGLRRPVSTDSTCCGRVRFCINYIACLLSKFVQNNPLSWNVIYALS